MEKFEGSGKFPLLKTRHGASNSRRNSEHTSYRLIKTFVVIVLVTLVFFYLLPSTTSLLPIAFHQIQGIQLPNHHSLVSYENLQKILLATPNEIKTQEWSWFYTSGPHLAGANYSQASWTMQRWQEFGISAKIVSYDTYLNYPLGNRLALFERVDHSNSWGIKYEASLKEDIIEEDPSTALQDRIPTFHGYSANGNVTGQYVYVNYGTFADYQDLLQAGVSLEGKIALARYGGVFRGLIVKRAQELGMIGVVIFSDPGDDGAVTSENGVAEYPDGPARQPSSVQRGSTQFLSFAPGDPTTPGYPSKPGAPRQSTENAIPSIPSIPISYRDAIPILTALNGYGLALEDFNNHWSKNLGLKNQGVNYNIGPSPPDLVLNLVNKQNYVITPIWNVIGIINGTLSDEVVIVGNHRDAWIAGGAGDPNSGSAALNEVIRSFGLALANGWKPLRTIVFASWDGEEYGLLGSTEWVEDHLPWLSASSIAYVNVDIGTSGTLFNANASPLLNHILYEVTALVPSPNQTIPGQTVADLWNGRIRTIGSGSDFTAFQDLAGIPSVDISFKADNSRVGSKGNAVYHYHSNYDSFHWMSKYGDPGFHYHTTMAKVWALYVAKLAESVVIPFNATDYALALKEFISRTEAKIDAVMSENFSEAELSTKRCSPTKNKPRGSLSELRHLFRKLNHAANRFEHTARHHDQWAAELTKRTNEGIPWWKFTSKIMLYYHIKIINIKYKLLERVFLYPKGLDGRPWFKHVIFAPGLWTGYSGAVFPGLIESIEVKDWANASKWAKITIKCLEAARIRLI